jgi:hypothetical protein
MRYACGAARKVALLRVQRRKERRWVALEKRAPQTDRNKQAGRRDSTHAKVLEQSEAHNFASLGKRLRSLTSKDPNGTLVGGRTWAKRRAESSHRSVQRASPLHDTSSPVAIQEVSCVDPQPHPTTLASGVSRGGRRENESSGALEQTIIHMI